MTPPGPARPAARRPLPPPARPRAALLLLAVALVTSLTACRPTAEAGGGPAPAPAAGGAPEGSTEPGASAATTTPPDGAAAPAGSDPAGTGSPAAGSGAAGTTTGGTRFAVVGDSITAGLLPLEGTSVEGAGSWIPAAEEHAGLAFAGGWAVPGATTDQMRAAVGPLDADVLVLLAGTNDVGSGLPWATTEANLRAVVAMAGVPDVLLSAVPPYDAFAEPAGELNTRLAQLARGEGWTFVDPWADLVQDGTWIPGTSPDGAHPTDEVAALVGTRLAAAVAAAG